jgi:hypothetical protein
LPPFGGDGWLRLIDISLGDDAHRRAGPVASSARSWPAIDSHAAGASSVRRPARRICRWSSPTLPTATGIARSGTLASCSPAQPRFASSRTWSASARSRPGTGWTSVSCSTYPVTSRHSGPKDGRRGRRPHWPRCMPSTLPCIPSLSWMLWNERRPHPRALRAFGADS